MTETERKIPTITGLVTIKKVKKVSDHNHDKYITTP